MRGYGALLKDAAREIADVAPFGCGSDSLTATLPSPYGLHCMLFALRLGTSLRAT